MSARPDDRIPVRFGTADEAGPDDAVLLDAALPPAPPGAGAVARFASGGGHVPGCACCRARTPAATALAGLYRARALGQVPWFTRVLAVAADPAGVAEALRADRVAAARFRVEG